MKIGLALGSGGLRGVAHIGVISELERAGIKPDMVAGSSAGSIIAGLYASGMTPDEIQQVALNLRPRDFVDPIGCTALLLFAPLFMLMFGLRRHLPVGILKGDRLEKLMCRLLGDRRMSDLPLPCAIVSVDICTGEKIVFSSHPVQASRFKETLYFDERVSEAVRASCSIPGVFVWKQWQGRKLVDGAVREPVPARVLVESGCDFVIAVDLGYTGQADNEIKELPAIISQSLDVLGEEVSDYVLYYYADAVINPRLFNVSLTDTARIADCIEEGRRAAREAIPEIKRTIRRKRVRRFASLA